MANHQQATILTPKEVEKLRYPLPESMKKAAGLLRRKRRALERHLKQVRKEWERPLSKYDH
jgi:hypothetical protein